MKKNRQNLIILLYKKNQCKKCRSFLIKILLLQKKEMTQTQIWNYLDEICDPEIPVLSVTDLGIVREVNLDENRVEVVITPTYSGCPAMDMISVNIKAGLQAKGIEKVEIKMVWSPAWTTDWMTERGREKLKAYGIAPPVESNVDKMALFSEPDSIQCPRCNSLNTKVLSNFGSTACKAMHQCEDCKEPFDYFKCHK
jgi:ring-1,2-phenylacetyl-CoA epoxidase subunit PaaD